MEAMTEGAYSIGSASDNTLVIDDEGVAPHHATIRSLASGRFQVRAVDCPIVYNGVESDLVMVGADERIQVGAATIAVVASGPYLVTSRAAPLSGGPAGAPPPPSGPPTPRLPVRDPAPPVIHPPASGLITIGRNSDNAVVIPHPSVADHHAVIRMLSSGRAQLRDLGAADTFLLGRAISTAVLDAGSEFLVGSVPLRFNGRAVELVAARQLTASGTRGAQISIFALSVRYGGRLVLEDLELWIHPGQLCAVVGPSGSGKSTLFKAMLREEVVIPRGEIRLDGVDVAGEAERRFLHSLIGYVPQNDAFYGSLTIRQVLDFAARLRVAPMTAGERRSRVEVVAEQLGLKEALGQRAEQTSGGQRKRVSIAMELVGNPPILLLDEPTSALDAGREREIMNTLQELARQGRTVVCTTHRTENLALADQLLVLATGGSVAFTGVPGEALPHLLTRAGRSARDWADIMVFLSEPEMPGRPFKARAVSAAAKLLGGALPLRAERQRPNPGRWWSILGTLLLRQFLLLRRRGLGQTLALLLIPVVGALVAAQASKRGLELPTLSAKAATAVVSEPAHSGAKPSGNGTVPSSPSDFFTAISVLVTVFALAGTSLTYADVVAERAAMRRDWRVGATPLLLILSKCLVFGLVSFLISFLVAATFLMLRPGPPPGLSHMPAFFQITVLGGLITWASMALGLFISASSPRLERAVTLSTVAAILLVAFNGLLIQLHGLLAQLTKVLPSRWGVALFGSSFGLNDVRGPHGGDPLWNHTIVAFLQAGVASVILVVTFSALATVMLRRGLERLGDPL